MKRELFILFLAGSFLFVFPQVRVTLHTFLIRTLYLPLLSTAAHFEELLKIKKEYERLILLTSSLQEVLRKYTEETSWKTTKSGEFALPLAYEPLGVPQKIILQGGKSDSIRYGASVLQDGALVGKIIEVEDYTATCMTLFHPDFRVGVLEIKNGVLGLLRGGERLEILYLPTLANLRIGDTLVTSGLGGVYKRGIKVAVITKLTPATPYLLVEAKACFDAAKNSVFLVSPEK